MSTDPKRKELVVPINTANVPVLPSFPGVGNASALDVVSMSRDHLDALIYAASAKPHPLQGLSGTASTSAPAAPHRAEGEPLCLTDPVVHGSVTLTDRRKVEVQVLSEVVTWFKRIRHGISNWTLPAQELWHDFTASRHDTHCRPDRTCPCAR